MMPPATRRTAPARLVRREADQPKTVQASFDIAQTHKNNRKHWAAADSLSARAAMSPAVRRVIRMRSRYEAANNSWYSGILRTAVNHIIGPGPRLQLMTGNPVADRRLQIAFMNWSRLIDLPNKLRLMIESYWRDGEVFVMKVERQRNWPMTLDLRIFEAEQVASPWDQPILSQQTIDDGVRFDASTNEIEFHVLNNHPGGLTFNGTPAAGQWYGANEVLHLFRADRPGQTRGLPRATPSLSILPIMRRQELATLYASESAANFALYMKSNSPMIDPRKSPADFAEIEMAVNMLTILPAGWDVGQIDPKQPGPLYDTFQLQALMSFTRCTNMPFPLAAGTAKDSNFSSYKGDIRNVWKPEVIVEQSRAEVCVMDPILYWFFEDCAIAPGNLLEGCPPIQEIAHRWHWPPLPDIDPIDTANTAAIRLSTGQANLTQIHNEMGQNWDDEASRAALDFGVSPEIYKQAVFFKTFGLQPGQLSATPIVGTAGQPDALGGPTAAPTPAPSGEYTEIGQRSFNNNLKRMKQTLDSLANGDLSRLMAEQQLAMIGLSKDRIDALISDALDGQVDDPALQEVQVD